MFTGKLQALISWALTGGSGVAAASQSGSVSDASQSYTDGTGDGKAQALYTGSGTITSGSNVDLDLAGSLTNGLGVTVAITKIKGIQIRNKSTATGALLTIGLGTNPITSILGGTTPTLKIGPKGWVQLNNPLDGYAVAAGTADVLRLAASGGNVDYEIVAFGE